MTGSLDDAADHARDDAPDGVPDGAPEAEPTAAEVAGIRLAALVAGGTGAVALAAACVLYLAAGPPYGQNVAAGVVYLVGLLAGVVAGVVLWMAWSTPEAMRSPRRPAGLATSAGALLMTGVSTVATLGRVGSPGLRVALIGAAAVVLAAAVVTLGREPRPEG